MTDVDKQQRQRTQRPTKSALTSAQTKKTQQSNTEICNFKSNQTWKIYELFRIQPLKFSMRLQQKSLRGREQQLTKRQRTILKVVF